MNTEIGFCSFLTIIFVILRCFNVILWEWYWIISPLWIPLVLVFLMCLVAYIVAPKEKVYPSHPIRKEEDFR